MERQIAAVCEHERARIGQDLHDGLGQLLSGVKFQAGLLESKLRAEAPGAAKEAEALEAALTGAIEETRKIVRGLHPACIRSSGLAKAIREFAAGVSAVYGVDCTCRLPDRVKLDRSTGTHLYRITQEAVRNAVQHGRASRIRLTLQVRKSVLTLEIQDNGRGIPRRGKMKAGLGLLLMNYRTRAMGGSLEIRPGSKSGTRVVCRLRRPVGRSPGTARQPT